LSNGMVPTQYYPVLIPLSICTYTFDYAGALGFAGAPYCFCDDPAVPIGSDCNPKENEIFLRRRAGAGAVRHVSHVMPCDMRFWLRGSHGHGSSAVVKAHSFHAHSSSFTVSAATAPALRFCLRSSGFAVPQAVGITVSAAMVLTSRW